MLLHNHRSSWHSRYRFSFSALHNRRAIRPVALVWRQRHEWIILQRRPDVYSVARWSIFEPENVVVFTKTKESNVSLAAPPPFQLPIYLRFPVRGHVSRACGFAIHGICLSPPANIYVVAIVSVITAELDKYDVRSGPIVATSAKCNLNPELLLVWTSLASPDQLYLRVFHDFLPLPALQSP